MLFLFDAYTESRAKSDTLHFQPIKLKLATPIRKILYPFGSGLYVTLYSFIKIITELSCSIIYSLITFWLEYYSQIEIKIQRSFFQVFIPFIFSIYICGFLLSFCVVLIESVKQREFRLISAILLIMSIFLILILFIYIYCAFPLLVCIVYS